MSRVFLQISTTNSSASGLKADDCPLLTPTEGNTNFSKTNDNVETFQGLQPPHTEKSRKIIISSDVILKRGTDSQKTNQEESALVVDGILQIIIETVIDLVCDTTKKTKKGTERKRKKYETSLEQRRKQRRNVRALEHGLKGACNEECKQNCSKKIGNSRREVINNEFWQLTGPQQKEFIFNTVKKIAKKRRTVAADTSDADHSRRQRSFLYFLKDSQGMDCRVCKKFFLGTLGYANGNDRIIRDVLNTSSSEKLIFCHKKKGHPSEKKIDKDPIIAHINSFKPTISHYRREHAPNRKYLPSDINVTLMHKDYLQKNPDSPISYELYRKQVVQMNISFAALGHEECWQCESFDTHSKSANHNRKNIPPDCPECVKWQQHHEHAIEARSAYKNDASNKELFSFSVDLQKVGIYSSTFFQQF